MLVFDVHPGSRRMISFVLGARGHLCRTAASVDEALAMLADFRADALVYDWNTRAGKLLGLARRIRAAWSHVLAAVVTSTLDEPPGVRADELIDDYFAKPVVMGDVVSRVELIVRSRR